MFALSFIVEHIADLVISIVEHNFWSTFGDLGSKVSPVFTFGQNSEIQSPPADGYPPASKAYLIGYLIREWTLVQGVRGRYTKHSKPLKTTLRSVSKC